MELVLVDGRTESGRHVKAVQNDHPLSVEIWIDGEQAVLTERPSLYRDGGTREFRTDKGLLRLPRKLGSTDRTPRLDGELVTQAASSAAR